MTSVTTKPDSSQPAAEMAVDLFDNWFDLSIGVGLLDADQGAQSDAD